MTWLTATAAFLKALPEMVSVVRELNNSLINLADMRTEYKINSIKREIDEVVSKVKNENDRDRLLELAKRLNSARL